MTLNKVLLSFYRSLVNLRVEEVATPISVFSLSNFLEVLNFAVSYLLEIFGEN